MTADERLDELLASFRVMEGDMNSHPGQRHAHVAALVVEDPDLRAVVAAWSTADVSWTESRRAVPPLEKVSARWRWIWLGVKWDVPEIAAAAGLGLEVARAKVAQAATLRIIYPDGSLNVWAKAAMAAMITAGTRRPPRGKRERTGASGS